MAEKEINIDKLLIGDLNIQSDFEAMNNELINNNNQDMVKPFIYCSLIKKVVVPFSLYYSI